MAQLVFNIVGELADLAQIAQIEGRRLVQNLEQKAGFLIGTEKLCRTLIELGHNRRFFQTNRDDVVLADNDGQRQGIVAILAPVHGYVGQNHDGIILNIRMGALLIIECGTQKVRVNLGEIADHFQLIRRRVNNIYPGPLLQGLKRQLLQRAAFQGFVNL